MTDTTLSAVEQGMVRLRRHMTRRRLAPLAAAAGAVDATVLGVLDAIEEGPPEGGGDVTVGLVASRLGLDPSRGSRAVAAAVDAGCVQRVASATDSRRTGLRLTRRGRAVAARVHRRRQEIFDEAMRGWTERERAEFAALLTRFVDGYEAALAGEGRTRAGSGDA